MTAVTKTATTSSRPNADRPRLDLVGLRQKLQQWGAARREASLAAKEAVKLKAEFKATVERFGVTDENGSKFIEVDAGPVVAIKNEARRTSTFDAETAEAILRKKGLWEPPYVQMKPVIDQDAIRGAIYERKLTAAEERRIFGVDVSYAFVALDANGKVVTGW